MAITAEKLVNKERYCGDNIPQFLLYLPLGIVLLIVRIILALFLWIASIILPKNDYMRQMLSTVACIAFGVHVKVKGQRDPFCSMMVANYVTCMDSLAASHAVGAITLRKWKVPPFFASILGIKNAAQFDRKQHFSSFTSQPVMVQPEGAPTAGRGLLQFTDWPFQLGNKVQPVAISAKRLFTNATVHRWSARAAFPWRDTLWFLLSPYTTLTVRLLAAVDRSGRDDDAFVDSMRRAIADALQIEKTDYKWEDVCRSARASTRRQPPATGASSVLMRQARQVRDVLPRVPMKDILRDLARTRSVDVTITNFLEGVTPYVPEDAPGPEPAPSTSQARYVTPAPTGVFPHSAKERQVSFHERKAQMIAEARRKYIEKHGLDIAVNNC